MNRPFLPSGTGSPRVIAALATTVLLATILGGCVMGQTTNMAPGQLSLAAHWAPWKSEPLPHLYMDLKDVGDGPLTVGPAVETIVIAGPNGTVPIQWETFTSRALQSNENVTLILHPRQNAAGHFELSIDHEWGQPHTPPTGSYLVCFDSMCVPAVLSSG